MNRHKIMGKVILGPRVTTGLIATALIVPITVSVAWGNPITITEVSGFPNERTSNYPPSNAVDMDINTFTWTTESYNIASPSHIAIGFDKTTVNRLRLWKDNDGGGGENIKNLKIEFTVDAGPLETRSWTAVGNLDNGFNGTELLHVTTAVTPNGYVIGDIHNSLGGDGWASLTFKAVKATGLRIAFSNPDPYGSCAIGENVGFCNHYHVGEFEAHFEKILLDKEGDKCNKAQ